jgi:hypothetical protein
VGPPPPRPTTDIVSGLAYDLIERYITFRTCYIFVIIEVVSAVFFLPMMIFPKAQNYLNIISILIIFTLKAYIIVGYIKYSFIVNERKFREIMAVVIVLFIMNLILNLLHEVSHFTASLMLFFVPTGLSYLLLFYGFRLIQNAESVFFRKLSKLNLSLFVIGVLTGIGMGLLTITKSFGWILLVIPIGLAGFYVIVLLIYWEFKLFRHLHFQYEKIAQTVN